MKPIELHAVRDVHRKLPLDHHTSESPCEVCQLLAIIDTQTRFLAHFTKGEAVCQHPTPLGICGLPRHRHTWNSRHGFTE